MKKVNLISSIVLVLILFSSEFGIAITDSRDLKDIGIDEKLGDTLPDDITIIDENNNPVLFKDLLSSDTPTVLNLVYYSCPRLCNFATDGLLQVVNETLSLEIGKDYKLLTVSFDPADSSELAATKALKYRSRVKTGKQTQDSWPFFTSDQENIEKLTQSVGFKYKIDGNEFAHASALIVLTPQGRISRYLHGIQHVPNDFRLSLLEASKGEIGTSKLLNSVLLFCYGFDPVGKKYALKALNIVKAGGLITLLSLCVGLTYFWRRERR
ncbi:MAG: SCO family protein [Thermodesulfobacteriales bacterium]|jgi:protein SCO1/2|nr:MAG: SCO family protein [Thermodesulfobacteriales bacterium]